MGNKIIYESPGEFRNQFISAGREEPVAENEPNRARQRNKTGEKENGRKEKQRRKKGGLAA